MIVKEDLLKKLRAAFDLNIYEVKIWTSLLCRGVATAGELSDISQIPRSRSYDVLDSLEKKGFVMMKLGKPIKYIAIDPNDIIIRVKDQIKEKTESKITSLENIKGEAIFDELNLLYTQGITKVDSTTLSSSMKGRDSIYAQLKSMIESAEKDVIIVTSEEGVVRKLKKFKNLFSRVNNKGVKIRIAAPLNNLDKNLISNVANFANMRDVGDFDARFCAVDGKEVLFMVADDVNTHEAYDTAVWVNSPFFSEAFISMFDSMWNKLPEMK